MHPSLQATATSRRAFLARVLGGLGSTSLIPLLGSSRTPRIAPRAKRIIHLYMAGGPSHLETLDADKPKLAAMDGKPMPASVTRGQQIAQLQGSKKLVCMAPQFPVVRCGESGQQLTSIFPHMARIADDMCIVRSMRSDHINHDTAHALMNTGTAISGRPSMGSWLLHALGAETNALPGFVVLTSVGKGGQAQPIAARQWHSGFLPGSLQGVKFMSAGAPVLYAGNPAGVDPRTQRDVIDAVRALNRHFATTAADPEIETRNRQNEMAFRMQTSIPELMDLSDEPRGVLDLYGTEGGDGTFASNCLLARRLAERGVRCIQVYHRAWDHHGGVKRSMKITAREVDQASAALVVDLKRRGMLDDTLVLWGGEFGRTPMAQGSGRDHHIRGFSLWMAGGGIRPGVTYGATDDLGYNAVDDIVEVHDLHATILHLFGIDHEKLTHRFQGRDFRLTDVSGHVLHDLLV